MTSLLGSRVVRFPIALIAFFSWLAVTNHCVLGAMEGTANMPMAACHASGGEHNSPAKNHGEGSVECCKVLRAIPLPPSKSAVASDNFQFVLQTYVIAPRPWPAGMRLQLPLELDTGPPFVDSFAESVLQRSLLAHAPPFLA